MTVSEKDALIKNTNNYTPKFNLEKSLNVIWEKPLVKVGEQ